MPPKSFFTITALLRLLGSNSTGYSQTPFGSHGVDYNTDTHSSIPEHNDTTLQISSSGEIPILTLPSGLRLLFTTVTIDRKRYSGYIAIDTGFEYTLLTTALRSDNYKNNKTVSGINGNPHDFQTMHGVTFTLGPNETYTFNADDVGVGTEEVLKKTTDKIQAEQKAMGLTPLPCIGVLGLKTLQHLAKHHGGYFTINNTNSTVMFHGDAPDKDVASIPLTTTADNRLGIVPSGSPTAYILDSGGTMTILARNAVKDPLSNGFIRKELCITGLNGETETISGRFHPQYHQVFPTSSTTIPVQTVGAAFLPANKNYPPIVSLRAFLTYPRVTFVLGSGGNFRALAVPYEGKRDKTYISRLNDKK